jgi:hypothetical protein
MDEIDREVFHTGSNVHSASIPAPLGDCEEAEDFYDLGGVYAEAPCLSDLSIRTFECLADADTCCALPLVVRWKDANVGTFLGPSMIFYRHDCIPRVRILRMSYNAAQQRNQYRGKIPNETREPIMRRVRSNGISTSMEHQLIGADSTTPRLDSRF